jgi:hypothetical protein
VGGRAAREISNGRPWDVQAGLGGRSKQVAQVLHVK